MKSTALLFMTIFLLTSCGTRESIRSKYLYSDRVKDVLTNEEYYKLDKEAKWPSDNYRGVCVSDESSANFGLEIKEVLLDPEDGLIVRVNKNTYWRKQIDTRDIEELKSFKQNVTTALWGVYTLVLGVIAKLIFWK